jgi:hypothetical protein
MPIIRFIINPIIKLIKQRKYIAFCFVNDAISLLLSVCLSIIAILIKLNKATMEVIKQSM